MKIISVIFFALALSGSWALAHAKKSIPESVHAGIQEDLRRVISEYLQKNVPESKNLRFDKFWTETVNAKQVRATFAYTYDDKADDGEPAQITIQGSATLNKIEETAENSTWSFDAIKILNDEVNFSEPMQIVAGKGAPEPSDKAESTFESQSGKDAEKKKKDQE